MSKVNMLRGHEIEMIDGEWVYKDSGEKTAETHELRDCGHCNLPNRPDGHDACIGYIDGAVNACCGHGVEDDAYVQFSDLRGSKAITLFGSYKIAHKV